MNTFAILNLITIVAMMATAGRIAYIISDMKYSLYRIVIRRVFWKDHRGITWLYQHDYYIWYNVLLLAMVATALTLIGQFMRNDIFTKPSIVFTLSAILWVSLFFVIESHRKSLKDNIND